MTSSSCAKVIKDRRLVGLSSAASLTIVSTLAAEEYDPVDARL